MWDLLTNDDEAMIAESVRGYLAREAPLARLRSRDAAPVDLASVRAGMFELGWFGVGLPDAVGGAGLGLVEEMLVQRECGRFLITPGAPAAVLAAHAAVHAGDHDLAREIVAGRLAPAFALPRAGEDADAGRDAYAFDWSPGEPLIVCTPDGVGLFDACAFTGDQPDACLDDSVAMRRGRLDRRPRCWIGAQDAPLAQRAQVLLAAAMVGLAEHACDLAVDYAKVREQFGRPIGSFQAVKHRCADMGVRARLAWRQTCLAALKLQAGEDAVLHAAAAKLTAARAAQDNGRSAIQVHGGVGFQAECDVHWFVKRARLLDEIGGAARTLAAQIAALPSPLW